MARHCGTMFLFAISVPGAPSSPRDLFGDLRTTGTVRVDGAGLHQLPKDAIPPGSAQQAVRGRQALLLQRSVLRDNVSLAILPRISRFHRGAALHEKERGIVQALVEPEVRVQLPASSARDLAHLSGGNQQKAMLGRWPARKPKVLHPRRADPLHPAASRTPEKAGDLRRNRRARRRGDRRARDLVGAARVMSGLADRVLRVMQGGRIVGELSR